MSSQLKTENYGLCQYSDNDIPDWRTDYTGDMAVIDDELANINKEVTELKKSVSDGKEKVATAITDKGVATETTDSFDIMASNIKKIPTGSSNTQVPKSTTVSQNIISVKITQKEEI